MVILTDGSGSHPGSRLYPPAKLATLREQEVAHAVRVLGLPPERLICLREPDTNAPHVGPRFDAIVRRLSDYVRDLDCSTILAPWRLDAHRDHESAACWRVKPRALPVFSIYPIPCGDGRLRTTSMWMRSPSKAGVSMWPHNWTSSEMPSPRMPRSMAG